MRVLITGITGFVGRHLTRCLVSAGHRVSGLDQADAEVPGARVFGADVTDPTTLDRVLGETAPEVIVHLAGRAHVGASFADPGGYLRVNFDGTANLVASAAVHGEPRIVFASSAEVYGAAAPETQPITEDHPLDPRSPYAMTKACAERLIRDAGGTVVRSFNVVGPGQSPQFALPSFARQLAAIHRGERPAEIRVGDLSPRRDFTGIDDAVDGYRTLIEHGASGEVYNLATGEARSIGDMLGRLREIAGVDAEVVTDETRLRPVDMPLLVGDAHRLRALGWELRHGLDHALETLWQEALEENP